jgi:hypothetical protein
LKKAILAAVAVVAAAVLGFGSLTAPTTHANPAKVWVINQNVLNALDSGASNCGGACDPTTAVGRAKFSATLDTVQTASAGQVQRNNPADPVDANYPEGGFTWILVQTDGSNTAVTLNGRGLSCDAAGAGSTCGTTPTPKTPDATDHFVVYKIVDTGTHSVGDTLTVTATQDTVALDSSTITVVGQAHDFQVTVVGSKTTIQEQAASCAITDSITAPTRAGVLGTYTDINGNSLVGYGGTGSWSSSSPSLMKVSLTADVSMVLTDGTTIADYNVICGVAPGSPTLTVKTGGPEVVGTGAVTRTQAITVTGVPAAIALTADPATIACDGSATSTVTAKVTDSAGNNVVDNTPVEFDVVALGTANPIQAKTTDGTATSTITPLSANVAGTTVIVKSGDVQASIRIDCLQPTPTPIPPVPTATPKGGAGGIVGPGTGTGGYLGQESTGSFPMWTLIALALGSVALVAGGMVTRRAGK